MHPLRRDCRRRGHMTHCGNRCYLTEEKSRAYRAFYGDFETPEETSRYEAIRAARECTEETRKATAKVRGCAVCGGRVILFDKRDRSKGYCWDCAVDHAAGEASL